MADSALSPSEDPTLYLYTSLTAGSSHIITATSRMETILKANKIPFSAIDVATDEKARRLWSRRSRGKKLPGLVKFEMIVGDLEEVEEWNEYGELKMQLGGDVPSVSSPVPVPLTSTPTSAKPAPSPAIQAPSSKESAPSPRIQIQDPPSRDSSGNREDGHIALALRQAGEEAAQKAKQNARAKLGVKSTVTKPEETTTQKSPEPTTEDVDDDKSKELKPPDSPKDGQEQLKEARQSISLQRPSIADTAAESTADVKVDSPTNSKLVEHHRGSVVSATSPIEQAKLAEDLNKIDSGASAGADDIKEAATTPSATKDEPKYSDPTVIGKDDEPQASVPGKVETGADDIKEAETNPPATKDEPKDSESTVVGKDDEPQASLPGKVEPADAPKKEENTEKPAATAAEE
ncbi:hypothetical protein FQN50_009048 [Emmonsiellopsis sp. PD_5]|nr:hypothetical protein FQN50_009048 [Emmonsiellopsis sp. PD_5]